MPGEQLDSAEVGVTYTGDATQLQQVTQSAQQMTAQLSQSIMQQAGVMRTAGLVMAGAGALGMKATQSAVKSASQVEAGYAKVNTMLDRGQDAYTDYSDAIKDMVKEIPIAGGELGALEAQYMVLSAGINAGADATHVLEVAMKASVGGMTSAETAVDAITTAINAYGYEAEQATMVSDLMFEAVRRGKMDYEGLAGALGPILGIASQAGMELQQVTASLATLTKAGIQIDEAGTAIRGALMGLMKPSEAMATQLQKLGYESGVAMIEALGFQGTLEELANSVGHNQEKLTELFPNIRALTAVLPLTGKMADQAGKDLEAMAESAGASAKAYEDMADTVEAEMQRLESRMEIAMNQIAGGATPVMMGLKRTAVVLAESLGKLNQATGGMVGVLMSVGSAIMTVIGAVISSVAQYTLMTMAHMQVQAMLQGENALLLQNAGLTAQNTGQKMANIGATQLQTASELQVRGAIKFTTIAHAESAQAQQVEAVKAVQLATAKKILTAQTNEVATATLRESLAHQQNNIQMTKGQLGALKMSGGFMKLAGMAGPLMAVTGAIAGMSLAVGALVQWYRKEKAEHEALKNSLSDHLDMMDDGTEAYKAYAETLEEYAEGGGNASAKALQHALAQDRLNDSWEKGSKKAMKQKEAWIQAEIELSELEMAFRKNSKVMKEINDEADRIFGTTMSEAEAVKFLRREYDLTAEKAKYYVEQTGQLTEVQLKNRYETLKAWKREQIAQQKLTMADNLAKSMHENRRKRQEEAIELYNDESLSIHDLTVQIEANEAQRFKLLEAQIATDIHGEKEAIKEEIHALNMEEIAMEKAIQLKIKYGDATEEATRAIEAQMTAHQKYLRSMEEEGISLDLLTAQEKIIDNFMNLTEQLEGWNYGEELMAEYADYYEEFMTTALEGWKEANPGREIGGDMIEEWLEGIEAMGGPVDDMMKKLMEQFVMDYMGFSKPKRGPLRGIPESGGHMIQEWVGGAKQEVGRQGGVFGDVGAQVVSAVGGSGRAVTTPGRTIHINGPVTVRANDPVQFIQKMWDLVEDEAG